MHRSRDYAASRIDVQKQYRVFVTTFVRELSHVRSRIDVTVREIVPPSPWQTLIADSRLPARISSFLHESRMRSRGAVIITFVGRRATAATRAALAKAAHGERLAVLATACCRG